MNRKIIITLLLILTLVFSSIGFASATPSIFPDLSGYNWAEDYIDTMVLKGGMEGYPDGTFKPGNTITVAEFIKTTVALVDGEKDKTDSHWASGYMDAALTLKITPEGMFEKSDWDKPISREKMAVIMERTAQFVLKEKVSKSATLEMFYDRGKMSEGSKEYLAQAVSRGLINGLTPNTFGPQDPANRAHAATMLSRLVIPIYRLTLTEADIDKITGVTERGKDASVFAKGVVLGDMDKYGHYDYVVYNSTAGLNMVLKENTSTSFRIGYHSTIPVDVFNKKGEWLGCAFWAPSSGNASCTFQFPLSSVEYFGILNLETKIWEFYYNDLR